MQRRREEHSTEYRVYSHALRAWWKPAEISPPWPWLVALPVAVVLDVVVLMVAAIVTDRDDRGWTLVPGKPSRLIEFEGATRLAMNSGRDCPVDPITYTVRRASRRLSPRFEFRWTCRVDRHA